MDKASILLEKKLSKEVVRKLRLAAEADSKDEREIVCEEVFCDITGLLDNNARDKLQKTLPCCFYEVLSNYYAGCPAEAELVAQLCQSLWGQGYGVPIYTLLLHRWLLLERGGGCSMEQILKYVHVLLNGARSLFMGDVQGGTTSFRALYNCLAAEVVMTPEGGRWLPSRARTQLLSVVASATPYYTPIGQVRAACEAIPHPSNGQGFEFVVQEVVEVLSKLRSEAGLLRYLGSLCALQESPSLQALPTLTRLRLQSELYALTALGGPRYSPASVRSAAMTTLDLLFPLGKRLRWVVRAAFLALHPTDLLGEGLTAPLRWWTWLYGKVLITFFWLLYRAVVWRPRKKGNDS